MRIINAIWDQVNTGLRTCEIIFEKNDTFQTYFDADIEKDYQLSVVKVPAGDLELVHQLEENGYRYLENQMVLSFDISQFDDINPSCERLLKGFTCYQVKTYDEQAFIIEEISKNMFETDRFSLDPYFSESDTSSKRYANWIDHLFKEGKTLFFTIVREGARAGFFTMKQESKNIYRCPIAGIYNNYKSSGLIFVLTWFWLKKGREFGGNKLITSVSSNNRDILSSLSKIFSFRINEIRIVLRKVIGSGC